MCNTDPIIQSDNPINIADLILCLSMIFPANRANNTTLKYPIIVEEPIIQLWAWFCSSRTTVTGVTSPNPIPPIPTPIKASIKFLFTSFCI